MTKKIQSSLFQGSSDELLLDERVSKIVLPTLRSDRIQMDEKEVHWGLKSPELQEDLPTDTLQIYVGVGDTEDQATDWDIPDDDPFDDFDDIDDELPSPMTLSLNPVALMAEEEETTEIQVPVGISLQPIQEIQVDEELPDPSMDDDWDSINWDDVTLSDILGEETEVIVKTPSTDTGAALFDLDEESSEEIFPVQFAVEDIPDWTDEWDHDLSEEGAELNLDDDWFAQESSAVLNKSDASPTEHQSPIEPPEFSQPTESSIPIVPVDADRWWGSPLVVIWVVILLVSFCAALVWRIMQ